jgi:hypothetical protein
MADLYFGLIHQNISTKKASFHYQGCHLSLKSGKLWQAELYLSLLSQSTRSGMIIS